MKLDRLNQWLLATVLIFGALAGLRIHQQNQPLAPLWTLDAVAPGRVRALIITEPEGGTIRIEKADSGWKITAPKQVVAERRKVDGLIRDWADAFTPDLKIAEQVEGEDLERYGLDEASRKTLQIEGDGGTLVDLQIGESVSGGSNYLRRTGDQAVYRGRVPGSWRLKASLDEWRDKKLFPFAKDDLAGMGFDNSHGSFAFQRIEEDKRAYWQAVEPADLNVSSRTLDTLGRSLSNLKAQRIIEGEEAVKLRPTAGLDEPRIRVWAKTEQGDEHVLRFGADEEEGRTVYAAVDGDERLFVLTIAGFRQFEKSAADLRDKTVVHFRRDQLTRLSWTEGERVIEVGPEAERDWQVLSPEGFRPSPKQLNTAINSLLNMQAKDVLLGVDAGVEPGGPVIEIVTVEGTQVLRFGAPQEGGDVYGSVDGKAETYLLRKAIVERFFTVFRAG